MSGLSYTDMDKSSFPQRLKTLREAFSVSQFKLSEELGVKQYYLSKWESGVYEPNAAIQQKIANYFKVSPRWLSGGVGHVFNGIVFIPQYLVSPRKKLDLSLQMNIVSFICKDGARTLAVVANSDNKPDGMIVFKRDEYLLLFLPYVSFNSSPGRYNLTNEMINALVPCHEIDDTNDREGPRLCNLTAEQLYMINSSSALEEIEPILGIPIPEKLKETYSATPLTDDPGVKKIEWEYTAEIRFAHSEGISESKALEEIMNIGQTYNDANEGQKLHIVKLKRGK
jgi:transcriptional regulator with XRE-family HTH domain